MLLHSTRIKCTACIIRRLFSKSVHLKSSQHSKPKVAVLGASGGIGQPLSLLLKASPKVGSLSLYDIVHTRGVAADLGHVNTRAAVSGYIGTDQLKSCLTGSDVVFITASGRSKPGTDVTNQDWFDTNAGIVRDLVTACADFCPEAMLCIVTNPVNALVPMAAEILKKKGVHDWRKLFGVTGLDIVRSNTFVAEVTGYDVTKLTVPVTGGNDGTTIVPFFSDTVPPVSLSLDERKKLTEKIQSAHREVQELKKGQGSATLSVAYAAAKLTFSLLDAMSGEDGILDWAFIESHDTEAPFLTSPVLLGKSGIEIYCWAYKPDEYEVELFKSALPKLEEDFQKGVNFVHS